MTATMPRPTTAPLVGKALAKAPAFPQPEVLRTEHLVAVDVLGGVNRFYDLYLERAMMPAGWRAYRCRVHHGAVGTPGEQVVFAHGAKRADAEAAFAAKLAEKTAPARGTDPRGQPLPTYTRVGLTRPQGAQVQAVQAGGQSVAVAIVPGAGGPPKVVGAPAVLSVADAKRQGLKAPPTWAREAQTFFNRLLDEASCSVAAGMQVSSVSAAGLQTPLGLVDGARLQEALRVLTAIEHAIGVADLRQLIMLNDKLFRLVPRETGVNLYDALVTNPAEAAKERTVLETAQTLIRMHTANYVMPVELRPVAEARTLEALTNLLRRNACSCHPQMATLQPTRAFEVTRPEEIAAFRKLMQSPGYAGKKPLLLLHGTKRELAAGILTRGLLPRRESGKANGGTAYGDGIYGADNAGKALGYTNGGAGSRILFAFYGLLRNPQTQTGRAALPFQRTPGTDGVYAEGRNGLLHNEWVFDGLAGQTSVAYLLEV